MWFDVAIPMMSMDEGSRDNLRTFLTLIATGREPPMDELWRWAEEQVVTKVGDEFERLLIKSGVGEKERL